MRPVSLVFAGGQYEPELAALEAYMFARVAVWEPMPTDDRNWVVDAAATVPGVSSYHLVDPNTGNGLSVAFFEDEQAASDAQAAIEKRAQEINWHARSRPHPTSVTFTRSCETPQGRPLPDPSCAPRA